jgi:hypothetical protein
LKREWEDKLISVINYFKECPNIAIVKQPCDACFQLSSPYPRISRKSHPSVISIKSAEVESTIYHRGDH